MMYPEIKKVQMIIGNENKYGFVIEDPHSDPVYVMDYNSKYELDEEVNEDDIREIIRATHYTISKQMEDCVFIFEGKKMIF